LNINNSSSRGCLLIVREKETTSTTGSCRILIEIIRGP